MMHRYEDFSVMTIDSFVNRLVRSFSKDLQWEEDFQIELDEEAHWTRRFQGCSAGWVVRRRRP